MASSIKVARLSVTTAIGLVCGASCTGTPEDRSAVSVRDSAGIRIIESRDPAWGDSMRWHIAETPTTVIGAVSSADPSIQFSRVTGLVRLSDGSIVVLDGQESEIRWFDAAGRHIATRGGRGRGPAEFNYAAMLLRLAGDTLLVEDRPRIEHVLFAPRGTFVREEIIDHARLTALGVWSECLSRTLPDRSLLACRPEPGHPQFGASPGPGHHRSYSRYVRVPRSLSSAIPLGLEGGIEQWGVEHNGRTQFAVHPFHARTVVAAGGEPLRIAIAINPEYSIEIWTSNGELAHIVRRVAARRAPTRSEREEARQSLARFAHGDQALANRFAAELEEPDSIPAASGLLIDSQNHLWVMRSGFLPSQNAAVADVFDETGTYLGELKFPDRFTAHEIGTDYVLGVRRDSNNVPFVELYELDRERRFER